MSLAHRTLFLGLCMLAGLARWSVAQQVTVETPFHAINDSFFERVGMSWGLHAPGFNLQVGGFGNALPPFGGFQPGAGIAGGVGIAGGGLSGGLGFEASQGSRMSSVLQSPFVTTQNGFPGGVWDASLSPFVVGVVPIVGGWDWQPAALTPLSGVSKVREFRASGQSLADLAAQPSSGGGGGRPRRVAVAGVKSHPLARKLAQAGDSSAARPAGSVAEARRKRAAEDEANQAEVEKLLAQGDRAAEKGKVKLARMCYEMAQKKATGAMLEQVQDKLDSLTRDE